MGENCCRRAYYEEWEMATEFIHMKINGSLILPLQLYNIWKNGVDTKRYRFSLYDYGSGNIAHMGK